MTILRPCAVVGLLTAALGSSGCALLNDYRPATVMVRDGETKQPIPGAKVNVYYLIMMNLFGPSDSTGSTGPDGLVHLRASASGHTPFLDVSADGYVDRRTAIPVEEVRAIGSRNGGKAQPPFVVDLYATPAPTVELIIPPGYRGLVVAEVSPKDFGGPPGNRSFSFQVPESGFVEVRGPRVLHGTLHDFRYQFRARFADGSPLVEVAHPPDPETLTGESRDGPVIGFEWVSCSGNYQFFAVGTKEDFDAAFRTVHKRVSPNSWAYDNEGVERWVNARRNTTSDADSANQSSQVSAVSAGKP